MAIMGLSYQGVGLSTEVSDSGIIGSRSAGAIAIAVICPLLLGAWSFQALLVILLLGGDPWGVGLQPSLLVMWWDSRA